jgi:hypothetical protein
MRSTRGLRLIAESVLAPWATPVAWWKAVFPGSGAAGSKPVKDLVTGTSFLAVDTDATVPGPGLQTAAGVVRKQGRERLVEAQTVLVLSDPGLQLLLWRLAVVHRCSVILACL